MNQFIFLYPIPQIIAREIRNSFHSKKKYKDTLNKCIDLRYRQKGYKINYAIFNDCSLSEVINFKEEDKIVKVDLDFKIHTTKREDGTYPYPDQDYILNQLGEVDRLVVTGFHMWDCVERLAKRAYERGINTLVDEDLTEFFPGRLRDKKFAIEKYPSFDPNKVDDPFFLKFFLNARKDKPWLWQDY